MNPPDEELIAAVLWLLGIALVLYLCSRHLLQALGISCYRNQVFGGPSELDPHGEGEIQNELHRQLLELGFEPLGMFRELILWHAGRDERVYASASDKCVAMVIRLLGGDPRVIFITAFESGVIVRTSNYSLPAPELHTADFVRRYVPTNTLSRALEEHRREQQIVFKQGDRDLKVSILDDVREVQRAYFFNPTIRRAHRADNCSIVANHLLGVGFFAVIIGYALSFVTADFYAPLGLLLGAVSYLLILSCLLRQATREMSSEQKQSDGRQELAKNSANV